MRHHFKGQKQCAVRLRQAQIPIFQGNGTHQRKAQQMQALLLPHLMREAPLAVGALLACLPQDLSRPGNIDTYQLKRD